jgi:P-type Ca2+ transporter type 2C
VSEEQARALTFVTLIVSNLALIFVSRSRSESFATVYAKPNSVFWWIVGVAGIALLITIGVPGAAAVFQFAHPSWSALSFVIAAAVALVLGAGWLLRRR